VDRFLLVPLLTPIVLVAAGNDAFGFDPPGYLDSFMYLGYFWHYPEHLPLLDDYYKISRLAWILPGYVMHAIGGVIAGSILLAYATLTAGAVALYLLVRDALHDRTSAAVVAIAWACCTWVHGVGGWNYHMLAAADYYLLACWLIVCAPRSFPPFSPVPALQRPCTRTSSTSRLLRSSESCTGRCCRARSRDRSSRARERRCSLSQAASV
jgi:hypothetical protein